MQSNDTPEPQSLQVPRGGVLFVSGFATSLRVERGHLVVRSGEGRSIYEGRFSRGSRPRIRRVLIYGKGGFTTWSALEWIEGIGASFALISRDGRVTATSGEAGPNQPTLRRAQVAAADTEIGLEIVRDLLASKLEGQLGLLRRLQGEPVAAIRAVEAASHSLAGVETIAAALVLEAKAASAYWGAWRGVSTRFARADARHIPEHWLVFGERQSPLGTSPRKAVTAAGALLNYLYALAEFECRLALLAVGLDPGLGWAHRDARYRDSAALDLLEALRPTVDEYVMQLLGSRSFSRREFAELPSGQVRLMPDLAGALASSLPLWERMAASEAAKVVRALARSAEGDSPDSWSRDPKGRGQGARSHSERIQTRLQRTPEAAGRLLRMRCAAGQRRPQVLRGLPSYVQS